MLNDLLAALEKEISAQESHMPLIVSTMKENNEAGSEAAKRQETGSANTLLTTNSKRKCVFCLQEHSPETCINVKDHEERKQVPCKYAKCYVYLNTAHRAFECRSRVRCKVCNGEHQVAICNRPKSKETLVTGRDVKMEVQPKTHCTSNQRNYHFLGEQYLLWGECSLADSLAKGGW